MSALVLLCAQDVKIRFSGCIFSPSHKPRAGTFDCPSIYSVIIHLSSVRLPRNSWWNFDESLEDDDTSPQSRHNMTFRAEDKVRYLFLIGLQEEGRVCLMCPPACLTHIYCWLFTASVEPNGHTEKKDSHHSRDRRYARWWTGFTALLYDFMLCKCEHFWGREELSSCKWSCPWDLLSLSELTDFFSFLALHMYNF